MLSIIWSACDIALVGVLEARAKDKIGRIWARTTGNVFLMVRKMAHGIDMTGQLRAAVERHG